MDRVDRRPQVRPVVFGALGKGSQGPLHGPLWRAGQVVVMARLLDRLIDRLGVEPPRPHPLDLRGKCPQGDVVASRAQLVKDRRDRRGLGAGVRSVTRWICSHVVAEHGGLLRHKLGIGQVPTASQIRPLRQTSVRAGGGAAPEFGCGSAVVSAREGTRCSRNLADQHSCQARRGDCRVCSRARAMAACCAFVLRWRTAHGRGHDSCGSSRGRSRGRQPGSCRPTALSHRQDPNAVFAGKT